MANFDITSRLLNRLHTKNRFLAKTLTSATNVGEALSPQSLSQIVTNTVVEIAPQLSLVKLNPISGKKREFNRLTALPTGFGAVGESGTSNSSNSTYERAEITMKEIREIGSVTDFLKDASDEYIDAYLQEIENVTLKQAYDLNYLLFWGNADSNTYEFSGLDRFITGSSRLNEGFSSGAPTVPSSLAFLDNMIDRAMEAGGVNLEYAFYCSPRMKSKITTLTDGYGRGVYDVKGQLDQIQIAAGKRVTTYRGIPIYETTMLGGNTAGTMGTVTAASGGTTGGSFSDGTYYFHVAPITYKGEEMASAQASVTLSGGTATQIITLSFTAFTGAIAYKVYYSTTTGLATKVPIKMTSAYTYNGSGTLGAAITSISITTATPGTEVNNMSSDSPLTAVSSVKGESIILHCLDPYQGMGELAYTNKGGSKMSSLVTFSELAKIDAYEQFLLRSSCGLIPAYVATSVMSRGWRVA